MPRYEKRVVNREGHILILDKDNKVIGHVTKRNVKEPPDGVYVFLCVVIIILLHFEPRATLFDWAKYPLRQISHVVLLVKNAVLSLNIVGVLFKGIGHLLWGVASFLLIYIVGLSIMLKTPTIVADYFSDRISHDCSNPPPRSSWF